MKRYLIIAGIVIVALAALYVPATTFVARTFTFSEGARAGVVIKLSRKGVFFKTWEGQLNIRTMSEPWNFSVEANREDLVKKLEEAQLSGKRVRLEYEERFLKVSWLGDTQYFIVDVETAGGENADSATTGPAKTEQQGAPIIEDNKAADAVERTQDIKDAPNAPSGTDGK